MADLKTIYRRMKALKNSRKLSDSLMVSDMGWIVRECEKRRPGTLDELIEQLARDKSSAERVERIWRLVDRYDKNHLAGGGEGASGGDKPSADRQGSPG